MDPCYRGAAPFVGAPSGAGAGPAPPDVAAGGDHVPLLQCGTCVFGGARVHRWDDVFISADRKAVLQNFWFFRICP